ncbi:hypothetical protein [Prescottella equi]|uniref:hypothetical protein n=1 Tax=Rhodococcus hoagii TaxID=43767 RepID=UPI000A103D40|nr:hypothetical protein [Prescottella equi]ORM18342.1 hypothetical protein A5N74_12115 [Prescottella equi]
MGQMPTFNADGWQPVTLISPDGRTYTPGDHTEHRQLLASGYREAPAEPPTVPAVSALAEHPDVKLALDAQQARDFAESAPESAAAANTTADATKPKSSRRNGGAQ